MSIQLAKTVYIGLGGTGAKSILKTKAMMLENYGEIPPMITFFVLDTDTRDKVSIKDQKGNNITFDADEFFYMTLPDVRMYVEKNPGTTKFLPQKIYEKKSSIVEGAGQYRTLGRLGLLSQANNSFGETLKAKIDKVRNWSASRDSKYSVNEGPTKIIVVFSIAGGTGAGSFIDFPLILRGLVDVAKEEVLMGIALLPDVYSTLGGLAKNVKSNAHTGITEYEFIADNKLKFYSPEDSDPALSIKLPERELMVNNQNLYDVFFTVNNRSSNGNVYSSINELTSFIGRNLYLIGGRTGGSNNSALDNIKSTVTRVKEKEGRYLGLGAAEMYLDTDKLSDYFALNQIALLCQNITTGNISVNINQEIDEKVALWQIKEDQGDDQVITAVSESKPKIGFSNIDQFDEDANISIKNKRDTWIQSQKSSLNSLIYGTNGNGTLSKYLGDKLNLLQQYIDEKTALPGGLEYARLFLNNFVGRMNAMREEMNVEKDSFDKKLSDLEVVFVNLLSDIKTAESISKFNVFKSRSKEIERTCEEYVSAVNIEITAIYERERRVAASLFYKALIEKSENLLINIDNFKVQMEQLSKRVSSELQVIKSKLSLDPFCIFVDKFAIERNNIGKEDVDVPGFLNAVNLTSLVNGGYSVDQLYIKFKIYTTTLSKYNELKNTGILDELGKMDIEDVYNLVQQLKNSVGIMRTLDKSEIFQVSESFTIGVVDANHDTLKRADQSGQEDDSNSRTKRVYDAFKEHFSYLGKEPEFSNTYDKNRIVVGCYQSGVPAFVIKSFDSYQTDYQNKPESEKQFLFSNKYWAEKINNVNYSIFPKEGTQENGLKAWVLAIIASKVEEDNGRKGGWFFKQDRGNYFVYSPKGSIINNSTLVDLGFPERNKAFQSFIDRDLCNGLLNKVKEVIKNNFYLYQEKFNELKNNPEIYQNQYSNHQLADATLHSPQYIDTKKMIDAEYQFIVNFVVGNELASL
jgi:hypothetical protein